MSSTPKLRDAVHSEAAQAESATVVNSRFLAAMERTASVVGPDFFHSAARLLSEVLDVRFVFLAECLDASAKQAKTLAFCNELGLAENYEFCAEGGPCETVMTGDVLHVESGLRERFPAHPGLARLGVESYLGCPLTSSSGRIIGHIAAMDVRPMKPAAEAVVILKLLASRAGAELERRQIEDAHRADIVRQSEERFRLAQEAAGIGTWDMDVRTGEGRWSDNYWGIYGLEADECTPGYEAWLNLVHPGDRKGVSAAIQAALEDDVAYRQEFRIIWPDGSVRWLLGKASVFRDSDGSPVRMIGVDYDVTERKEAEQELQRLYRELERRVDERTSELRESNEKLLREMAERSRMEEERRSLEQQVVASQKLESLGVLTGGVAHDFNNLLVTIMGNSELALTQIPKDSAGRRYIEKSVEAAERAGDLTKQLLSYSGQSRTSPRVLDLSSLVVDMAELLEVSTGQKVQLRLDCPETPIPVQADATQLRQVVMNLITNAAEAMPEGGVVRITTSIVESPPASLGRLYLSGPAEGVPCASLRVSDTGAGLDQETCSKIFDPFFTTKFLGRGLGLAAVLGIVGGHDGVIAVDENEGGGAVFTILLPLTSERAVDAAAAASESHWRGAGRVLVVDDEDEVRTTAALLLQGLGFETVEASGGREAVELFKRIHRDLRCVLLDFAMPEMNGADASRLLDAIDSGVPVVMTSGYGRPESAGTANVIDYVQKPFTIDLLRESMRSALSA